MAKQPNSSWESSAKWYDKLVGESGSYYHTHVIMPNLKKLMDIEKASSPKVLDIACGQGALARNIPPNVPYLGVDISKSLIQAAQQRNKRKEHKFLFKDVTKPLELPSKDYSHAAVILALQNIEDPLMVFKNTSAHLRKEGKLFLVLNHPCFRIPRQSHWGIDEDKKLQFRRMDSYMSPQKIPIQMHPGKGPQQKTWSFHHPLSSYTRWLHEAGFSIEQMEEWISDKESTGGRAKMENRARKEFPLFLTIVSKKTS